MFSLLPADVGGGAEPWVLAREREERGPVGSRHRRRQPDLQRLGRHGSRPGDDERQHEKEKLSLFLSGRDGGLDRSQRGECLDPGERGFRPASHGGKIPGEIWRAVLSSFESLPELWASFPSFLFTIYFQFALGEDETTTIIFGDIRTFFWFSFISRTKQEERKCV